MPSINETRIIKNVPAYDKAPILKDALQMESLANQLVLKPIDTNIDNEWTQRFVKRMQATEGDVNEDWYGQIFSRSVGDEGKFQYRLIYQLGRKVDLRLFRDFYSEPRNLSSARMELKE